MANGYGSTRERTMRLSRITIRRLMVVVAIAGIALGLATEAYRLSRLSRSYRAQAAQHNRERMGLLMTQGMESALLAETIEERRDWLATMERWRSGPRVEMVIGPGEALADWAYFERMLGNFDANIRSATEEIDLAARRIDHRDALIRKYTRAARYPWLPVAPDPPTPG